MLFSSLSFIFRFLPAFLFVYWICPKKGRNFVLLLGSLIFYALGEPVYVFLMLFGILVNFGLTLLIEKYRPKVWLRRTLLATAIVYNVGTLSFFKYYDFVCEQISNGFGITVPSLHLALPLGISFYSFQIMSYVIDVYRGQMEAEHSFIDLGAYICMFPQLVAGPIVVYKDIQEKLKHPASRVHLAGFEEGLRIFTLGLGSKVLLANRFGQVWETMGQIGYDSMSTPVAWAGAVAYTLQIYFDFNGYSIMAIGLGKMIGFDFPRNFDNPYIAGSVTDFWRRWHMTLTGWFREYLYIPLGGNRKGKLTMLRNMLIVWLVTGIWHGAGWNFILWGMYYFVILAIERFLTGKYMEKWKIPGHIITLFLVIVGWVIFAITDMAELEAYLYRMFAPLFGDTWQGLGADVFEPIMLLWLVAGVIFSTPLLRKAYEKYKTSIFTDIILFVIFWACIVQLTQSAYNPFLYFRF